LSPFLILKIIPFSVYLLSCQDKYYYKDMSATLEKTRKFGTGPVFFTAISTILGAVMFLRFGYSVGNLGFIGTLAVILIGHAVTIPTAMAIAEIATNQKVEGGGEYYIISRSFGLVIGSSIGIALYFSQAISVAFYIIAFSEAFSSLFTYLLATYELHPTLAWVLSLKQTVSIPALFLLTAIVLTKGADLGVKALYIVVTILFVALVAFFAGQTDYAATNAFDPFRNLKDLGGSPESFFIVFAIIFPAFTGMTAGVGLSGDLEKPGKSIPLGTLAGTITGMVIYFFITYKLSVSASPADLADTSQLVMAKIAWQGWWLIPVGLAAATISSALGSIMVAPRTLQAIARDKLIPSNKLNSWLSQGKGKGDDPFNSTLITVAIAFVFVLIGGLDAVAVIISMFFMVTYGSLCLISFLQHFAADPSYRPTFKSRWYLSLFGAIACFGLMFFMNAGYAFLALVFMVLIYVGVSYFNPDKKNLAVIFQGVIFQISRQLQVFLQKTEKEQSLSWRPSVICISEHSFDRLAAFDFLRWLSQKYGFGTYIHKIDGYLSKSTKAEANKAQKRLIQMAESSGSNIYFDTLISPSYTSAIAQVIQLPGISGTENNLLMLEYSKQNPHNLKDIVDNFKLVRSVDFDVVILGSSERGYGLNKSIHIWITTADYKNANLMILLAYIILGHRDWRKGFIKIFAIVSEETAEDEGNRLFTLIETGQLPISPKNIEIILRKEAKDTRMIINEKSKDADLTIIGFNDELLKHQGAKVFEGYEEIGNTVFVNAGEQKSIK
jgi:amino acid transporter